MLQSFGWIERPLRAIFDQRYFVTPTQRSQVVEPLLEPEKVRCDDGSCTIVNCTSKLLTF
jgi:hypothetical protein